MASAFAIPPSTTADAAATLCSNVYLDCFPPMDSSASLPNARYTHCHSLTVSRGMDRASAAGLQPTPASKSSTARLLDSRSCFTLRSILMENLPFPDVQEMGGSSLSPSWWFYPCDGYSEPLVLGMPRTRESSSQAWRIVRPTALKAASIM